MYKTLYMCLENDQTEAKRNLTSFKILDCKYEYRKPDKCQSNKWQKKKEMCVSPKMLYYMKALSNT